MMTKICTDVEQSKKLIGLGLDVSTADMGWNVFVDDTTRTLPINDWDLVKDGSGNVKFYHAWSLAALLSVLPKIHKLKPILDLEENSIQYSGIDLYIVADNPVDACYEMILKLHELKML